jgi:hypothetical protein
MKVTIGSQFLTVFSPFHAEVNFDCTAAGIALQALDPAHVSLVALLISADGFEAYRCDRPLTLGVNLESLTKILKCAGNDDSLTLRAADDGDRLTFIFEYKSTFPCKPTGRDLGLQQSRCTLDALFSAFIRCLLSLGLNKSWNTTNSNFLHDC